MHRDLVLSPRPVLGHLLGIAIPWLLGLAMGGVAADQALAQINWGLLSPAASPPPLRYHAMAYDAARQRVVLYGGDDGNQAQSQTWEWDGNTWALMAPATVPPALTFHAMAYDAARQRVVMFGGSNPAGLSASTWEWDGVDWVLADQQPWWWARREHSMAYDAARQRVVRFGGQGPGSYTQPGLRLWDDVWEWDGTTWSMVSVGVRPPVRCSAGLAYDSVRQRTVLFGGWSYSQFLSDTWEWDGLQWVEQLPASVPPCRYGVQLAFDALRQRVVMFGGDGNCGTAGPHNDTWEWDGVSWDQASPWTPPPPRGYYAMAYDEAAQRTFLFGGAGSAPGSVLGDSWHWGVPVPTVTAAASQFGIGCGSPPLAMLPDASARPLVGHTAAATISDAPTLAAGVFAGWSNTFAFPVPLPFELSGLGMPGCYLLHSNEVFGLFAAPTSPTSLSFSTYIPFVPTLLGVHVYLQAFCLAPGQNAAQVVVSNGIDWMIGDV